MHPNHALALALAGSGLFVFPCHPVTRKPMVAWGKEAANQHDVVHWRWLHYKAELRPAPAISCGPSGLVVIDLDQHPGKPNGIAYFDRLAAENGFDKNSAPLVRTPGNGEHLYFRHPPGVPAIGNGEGLLRGHGVNIRGRGGMVLAPGAITTRGTYSALPVAAVVNAPVLPTWLVEILKRPEPVARTSCSITGEGLEQLREPLGFISADCSRYEWSLVLAAIHDATGGSGEGLQLAHQWSATASKYGDTGEDGLDGASAIDYYWQYFERGRAKYTGESYIRFLATKAGWKPYPVSDTMVPAFTFPKLTRAEQRAERDRAVAEALARLNPNPQNPL